MTTLPPGNVIENGLSLKLDEGWRLARTKAGECATPESLAVADLRWIDARVPGTVASSLHADLAARGGYDADDWWYRLELKLPSIDPACRYRLRFDGLATLADVWLNGTHILEARNMFRAYRVDVTALLAADNEIVIRFAALARALAAKRPRPKWKTALVAQQNLRWFRTTLAGRIPGWTPPIEPVGPWGPIALEIVDGVDITSLALHATARGDEGRLSIDMRAVPLAGGTIEEARLHVGDRAFALECAPSPLGASLQRAPSPLGAGLQCAPSPLGEGRGGGPVAIRGDIVIPGIALWWPHTHGTPALHACQIDLRVNGAWRTIDCGRVGFRSVEARGCDPLACEGPVELAVNGERVFCRGACWMPLDILALRSDASRLRGALEQVRDAGANMLRVSGTMVYESGDFYRLCDELGILVWQDFMFANMDYPFGDDAFRAEAAAEIEQQLARLSRHACIAAYCGGSEIAQQAAMLGLPREHWLHPFFTQDLPRLAEKRHPGVPYFPATPWGGALPFHVAAGLTHYYGVGAYRRPLDDRSVTQVTFTPECLGFSNVPDDETIALVAGGATPAPHDPRWKARVPRDSGAGYDFEDVRDHYFHALFREDPVAARSRDPGGYLRASRVVSAEVMRRVFAQWRAQHSRCGGALVWFLRDLWPGAGWGVVDSMGRPKAAYWALKRAWQPRSIHLVDEGLDGYAIHVANESTAPLAGEVELWLLQAGRLAAPVAKTRVEVAPRGTARLQADALLGYFGDATDAYRFGPPKYDIVAARLLVDGVAASEDFCFPAGLRLPIQNAAGITARITTRNDGAHELQLSSDVFLQAVAIDCGDGVPDDNYFHLLPGEERVIEIGPSPQPSPKGEGVLVTALNLAASVEAIA